MCNAIVPAEDTLSERIFHSAIQSLELFGIYLGRRLGLYKVLEKSGAMTPGDLARAAGLHERYAPRMDGATGRRRLSRRRAGP